MTEGAGIVFWGRYQQTRGGKLKYRGFTFIEMLIVLCSIVAIASGIFVVGNGIFQTGRFNAARSQVAAVSLAVSQYHFETGSWPANLNTLTSSVGQYGPWIDADGLRDPWGNQFNYNISTAGNMFSIWSNGANKSNDSGSNPTSFSSDDIGMVGR